MATDTLTIADRLERSGVPPAYARALAVEIANVHEAVRSEVVTREYLDLALAKLRAETERDIARLELKIEGQGNRILVWISTIVGLGIAIVGTLRLLF